MIAAGVAAVPPRVGRFEARRPARAPGAWVFMPAPAVLREETRPMPSRRNPETLSDAELIAACARDDARAWRTLVSRYRRLAWGIPRSMGLQPADADEVFQTTFVELMRHLHRIERPERLEAWLVTTARRATLRWLGRERRRREVAAAALDAAQDEAPAVDPLGALEEAERLRRAVEALGAPCHTLIRGLFADPPRPYRVLARELGLAVGSLGALRARCLERLRRALARIPGFPERNREERP
jgi:RNA polymerase sigma factor (sigma-70 family)